MKRNNDAELFYSKALLAERQQNWQKASEWYAKASYAFYAQSMYRRMAVCDLRAKLARQQNNPEALGLAEFQESVTLADLSGAWAVSGQARLCLANMLHKAGARHTAEKILSDAIKILDEHAPECPVYYELLSTFYELNDDKPYEVEKKLLSWKKRRSFKFIER